MQVMDKISAQEQRQREHDVRAVRHSIKMEGGQVSEAAMADQDAYARGEIDEDEMVRRFRARYDLSD